MKLAKIQIQGYRSLLNVDLLLRDLTVLIGPNGAGKTALLEVFSLLRRAAEGKLSERLEAFGGAQAVISQVEKNDAGATQFTWADSLNLDEWLQEYTLSDLWRMGTLGGRP
jgi:predicted ATPase